MKSHLRFVAYIILSLTVLLLAYFSVSSPIKQSSVQALDVDPTPPPDMSSAASVVDSNPSVDITATRAIPAGGPGFFTQTVFAFQPYTNSSVPFSYSGRMLLNPDTSAHFYEAPVNLPHGATITRFVVWYWDESTTYNIWWAIGRFALDDSIGKQIGFLSSSDAAPGVRYLQDTTITDPVIDNESYVYWVEVNLPPNSAAGTLSFRIDYQYSTYVPLTTK